MKKIGLLLLAGALTFGLVACGGAKEETTAPKQAESTDAGTSSGVEEYTITAKNWKFSSDKELTIKKGTQVKINLVNDEGMHTISSEDLGIELSTNKPAEFTAEKT